MNFVYVNAFESYRITACECVHLVTRGHFRSRDKDGAQCSHHSIRHSQKHHATRKPYSSVL